MIDCGVLTSAMATPPFRLRNGSQMKETKDTNNALIGTPVLFQTLARPLRYRNPDSVSAPLAKPYKMRDEMYNALFAALNTENTMNAFKTPAIVFRFT